MILRLKATKTSLYKLVGSYEALPIMKRTYFTKYRRSYWLRWSDDDADYKAYLSFCAGKPMLAIERRSYDADGPPSCKVHVVPVDSLRALGMIEEA